MGVMNSADIEAAGGDPGSRAGITALFGQNLVNHNDTDVIFQNLSSDGVTPGANTGFVTTGFIKVESGKSYQITSLTPAGGSATTGDFGAASGTLHFYDANKVRVRGPVSGAGSLFTPQAGEYYVRAFVPRQFWPKLKIAQGSATSTPFLTARGEIAPPELSNPYQRGLLRWTHLLLARRSLPTPESCQCIINVAGDSFAHGASYWVTPFTEYLTAKYGDAGGGWCGFSWGSPTNGAPYTTGNQPELLNGNARPALYPVKVLGSPTRSYYSDNLPDLGSAILTQAGDAIEVGLPASPTISAIMLHWVGTGAGSVSYTLNGGSSSTTLNVSGTAGTTVVTPLSLTGLTQPGTLRIEWVSGTAKLGGVDIQSAASGVRVNKIGSTGSNMGQWNPRVSSAGWKTSYTALGGHLFLFMEGTNSQGSGNRNGWGLGLEAVAIGVRAAQPGTDMLVVTPAENQRTTNTLGMGNFALEARYRAYGNRFTHLNLQPAFGLSGDPSEYGSTGAIALNSSDLIHPEIPTGGRLIMAEVLSAVLPF